MKDVKLHIRSTDINNYGIAHANGIIILNIHFLLLFFIIDMVFVAKILWYLLL